MIGIYENTSSDEEDDLETELEEAGLDIDELEMMDEDERAQALEDAGLARMIGMNRYAYDR